MDVIIRKVDHDWIVVAAKLAKQFHDEYPDRVGFHSGVVYFHDQRGSFYAYRTKAGAVVVRGLDKGVGK